MSGRPIVLDSGTGVMKAGFAGEDKPQLVYNACVGRPKHPRCMAGGALEGDMCAAAAAARGQLHRQRAGGRA